MPWHLLDVITTQQPLTFMYFLYMFTMLETSEKGGNLYKDARFKQEPVWINGITSYTIKVIKEKA